MLESTTMQQIVQFFKDVYAEFKLVSWPTKNHTFRLTAYVIGVSLGVGLYVSGFDHLFSQILSRIIAR